MPKEFYESKTVLFNLLVIVSGTLAFLVGEPLITQHPQLAAGLATAAAFVNMALRWVTSVPIAGSPSDPTSSLSGPPRV